MKVLVVGQGGREHVLAWKFQQSPQVTQVFCAPGNAGTGKDVTNVPIAADDITGLLRFAQQQQIDLTVPGPEAPLVAGIVDQFRNAGLTVFGPTRKAAQLEGSKTFAKQVMQGANVPTADFAVFYDLSEAENYLNDREEKPVVVKADGLAAGKGVMLCQDREEALAAVRQCMQEKAFGEAGNVVVLEDFLEGQEASILAIVDGKTIVPLETSQDHKAAHDGDTGPNTGGMGAYSPAPLVTPEVMDEVIDHILVPTVHEMKKRGTPFNGILYAGLMLTKQGPKVLEFNVRLGDPEAQPVLMRLKTDLFELIYAAARGELNQHQSLNWDPRPSLCVVMAAQGYPGAYPKGSVIQGLDDSTDPDVKVFHAGTLEKQGQVLTNGGRVLGVTALGESIEDAKLNAYRRVKQIRWEGAWCRKDISDKARLSE